MSCSDCQLCEQPPVWEHTSVDGVFVKQMYLREAGILVPQHAHQYDHTSMLARGRIRAWADGVPLGEYTAPQPIFIRARVKHSFLSLEPETLIYCIHNVFRTQAVEIHAEHQVHDFSYPLSQLAI